MSRKSVCSPLPLQNPIYSRETPPGEGLPVFEAWGNPGSNLLPRSIKVTYPGSQGRDHESR